MCGIVGVIDIRKRYTSEALVSIATQMRDKMIRRGPDGAGVWHDAAHGIALGHRRLSIIDLSENGKQPMESPSGRYIITFNGEIYNFNALREQLAFGAWKSKTDTETLLVAFERWGIEPTLTKAQGMFALAVWDRQENTLTLARDRIGEKPLYYGWAGECFVFASDCDAIAVHPEFTNQISTSAVASFLRWNYIPAPLSIYETISKLPAGHSVCLRTDALNRLTSRPYWSAENLAAQPRPAQEGDLKSALHSILKHAIQQQMVGDVPVGAFLSGGIDSSLIVALMQAQNASPVRSFSVGFEEAAFNEAPYARAVAEHLGTRHTEITLTAKQAQASLAEIVALSDEPTADATVIPTYFVSKIARESVTVALSGAGGDELFGGYARYQSAPTLWNKITHIPSALRPYGADFLKQYARVLGNRGYKLSKFADALRANSIDTLHHKMTSYWQETCPVITHQTAEIPWPHIADDIPEPQLRMQLLDLLHYLPSDILAMTDKSSMALSLEIRAPLLDVSVVEFALQSPHHARDAKTMIKQILYEYVPRPLVDRPKMGFGVPIGQWLRGDLRDWADALLSIAALEEHGVFRAAPIRKHWHDFLAGKQNQPYHLWSILMFQLWRQSRK